MRTQRDRTTETRFLFMHTSICKNSWIHSTHPLSNLPLQRTKIEEAQEYKPVAGGSIGFLLSYLKNLFVPSKQQFKHKNLRMDLREIKLSPPTVCL